MPCIALVSYINTRPFIDGFEQFFPDGEVQFRLMPPADCARALHQGSCDMALIPVGALPNFDHVHLHPDYCIGANGPVKSVYMFSRQPIDTLQEIRLDPHSRSSNGLTRILMKYHWKQQVDYYLPETRNFSYIQGQTGGVVIGDEAIKLRDRFEYAYDLSDHWKKLTGLPFAFAVWAYRPGVFSSTLMEKLTEAMAWGIAQADQSALKWAKHYDIPLPFAGKYLTQYIDY
ncbi:MAG: menaquinone biosynthesis protein, partial [Bacteroidota bacterium]